mgnify:CR=1 FL=1
MNAVVVRKRCAVYTRVSTDERLDQTFNSLDAQREAGQAYIVSQRAEGWLPVSDDYDDGGYSGGNMERPALKRLMDDIMADQIDIVVVYKIDRLTRSLADFARLIEVFERHKVSFVSVTQQFNTTSSMGRLMLNILLSFAQFEREVTGERIRDKITASKRKGMWMGGFPPLGYDVKDRRLVVNKAEAPIVRRMFERFVVTRSPTDLCRELAYDGVTTKSWVSTEGRAHVGTPMDKKYLGKALRNPIYVGEIRHKGAVYPGQHEPIIARAMGSSPGDPCGGLQGKRWQNKNTRTNGGAPPGTALRAWWRQVPRHIHVQSCQQEIPLLRSEGGQTLWEWGKCDRADSRRADRGGCRIPSDRIAPGARVSPVRLGAGEAPLPGDRGADRGPRYATPWARVEADLRGGTGTPREPPDRARKSALRWHRHRLAGNWLEGVGRGAFTERNRW